MFCSNLPDRTFHPVKLCIILTPIWNVYDTNVGITSSPSALASKLWDSGQTRGHQSAFMNPLFSKHNMPTAYPDQTLDLMGFLLTNMWCNMQCYFSSSGNSLNQLQLRYLMLINPETCHFPNFLLFYYYDYCNVLVQCVETLTKHTVKP